MTKALADENRLRALMALRGRELCVCQIVELLGLAHSTVSRHLSVLEHAGLILGDKRGRWRYYTLAEEQGSREVRGAIEWMVGSLKGADQIRKDGRRLKEILKIEPEVLCRTLSGR